MKLPATLFALVAIVMTVSVSGLECIPMPFPMLGRQKNRVTMTGGAESRRLDDKMAKHHRRVETCSMLLLWTVMALHGPVMAQDAQAPKPVPGSDRRRDKTFAPDEQRAVRTSKGGITIALVESRRCKECSSGFQLRFEATRGNAAEARQFTIMDGPSQVDEIHILTESKAAVIGSYQSNVAMVLLLDITTGSVIDRWLCFNPSVSPDGSLIVYRKVHPLHFTEGVTSTYLVYAAEQPPAANRSASVPASDVTNVGIPFFPPDSTNVPGDNIGAFNAFTHQLASDGFFWLDDRRVAFADVTAKTVSIVVSDLSYSLMNPPTRIAPLDIDQILSRDGCREYREENRQEHGFIVSKIATDGQSPRLRVEFSFALPDCRGLDGMNIDM